jgi:HD superfamily phosphohydrolase
LILLRRLDASLTEQVAGLLHDVSHTAFSHVADFVFPNKENDFHERFFEKVIHDSEIPKILEEEGMKLEQILDIEKIPLVDSKIPNLCADRVDYFLRDYLKKFKDNGKVRKFYSSLRRKDDLIYIEEENDDDDTAEDFAETFIMMNEEVWGNERELLLYQVFSQAIKYSIDNQIIEENDLFMDDDYLMNKLKASEDEFVKKHLELLKEDISYVIDKDHFDYEIHAKARWVDPLVLRGDELVRTSELYEGLKEKIEEHRDRLSEGYFLRLDED